jgi:hypothetical protein
MLECKYCQRHFPTSFARTQHLRQKPTCSQAYKHELAALATRRHTWQVDDIEGMPSDMEGHNMDPVGEVDSPMEGEEREASDVHHDVFGSASLFEVYLASISAKSRLEPAVVPANE